MTVGQKQELFSRCLPRLITEAHRLGYQVRLRELTRTEQQAEWNATHCAVTVRGKRCEVSSNFHVDLGHTFKPIGIRNSLHLKHLAIDLYLRSEATGGMVWATTHYAPLGAFWEALDPLCSWGGDWGDPGHFSIRHGGVR